VALEAADAAWAAADAEAVAAWAALAASVEEDELKKSKG
jgi:hypothetical protein